MGVALGILAAVVVYTHARCVSVYTSPFFCVYSLVVMGILIALLSILIALLSIHIAWGMCVGYTHGWRWVYSFIVLGFQFLCRDATVLYDQ